MQDQKELQEAKAAVQLVLQLLDRAIQALTKARNWGIWDMIGGEFFASWMKRRRIREANAAMEELQEAFRHLSKELSDVHMALPESISNTMGDQVFDLFFDNLFTDLRVQGEIKETLRMLERVRCQVEEIDERLAQALL